MANDAARDGETADELTMLLQLARQQPEGRGRVKLIALAVVHVIFAGSDAGCLELHLARPERHN